MTARTIAWNRERIATAGTIAHREASDGIAPKEYAHWIESYLGDFIERIEEEAIPRLSADLRGKHLVDFGCGDGTCPIAASHKGAHVMGIDISGVMLDPARSRTATQAAIDARSHLKCDDSLWQHLCFRMCPHLGERVALLFLSGDLAANISCHDAECINAFI